jgi:hypothetical protein
LSLALRDQAAIGWTEALRGYLCTRWVQAQHQEHPRSPPWALRQQWLKKIIGALWDFQNTMWDHRNQVLHKSTDTKVATIRESSVDAQITTLYKNQDQFAAVDRAIFTAPLAERLLSSKRSKQHWLVIAKRYLTISTTRQGKQRLLTHFFTRQPPQGIMSIPTDILASSSMDNPLADPPNPLFTG